MSAGRFTGLRVAAWAVLVMLLCGAPAAGAASFVGALYVTTEPAGAEIYVAGELKGISPCAVPDVAIGEVELEAVKERYGTARLTVHVKPDTVSTVRLELKELANVGNILVLVEPTSSRVEVDRVPFGRTPARIINVEVGPHRIKVSHEGYRPFYSNVTVVLGRDVLVRGQLIESGGRPGEATGGPGEEDFGELDPDEVPSPDEMPEAKLFEPVRRLLSERNYQEASKLLERMAGQSEARKYMARIARDERYIQQIEKVVQAGYKALHQKVGQRCPLLLKGGISIEGKLLGVSDEHLVLDLGTQGGTQIDLNRLHVGRVTRLAASSWPPDKGSNQALFAVLYAMEGEFPDAYEALRRAAAAGYNVTDEKSFVDCERLWAAAKKKERLQKQKAEREKEIEERREALSGKQEAPAEPLVLIDRHHGRRVPNEIAEAFQKAGFKVKEIHKALRGEDLRDAAALVVLDAGERAEKARYTQAEVRGIAEFVSSGGGFVFFGAERAVQRRPRRADTPFEPLLRGQFKIGLRPGRMEVDPKAPRGYPRDRVSAQPTRRHPITLGVKNLYFRLGAPALTALPSAVIVATPRFVSSSATGRGPVALVAARTFGRGRVVVFSAVPEIKKGDRGAEAVRVCVNAVRWATYVRAGAARSN